MNLLFNADALLRHRHRSVMLGFRILAIRLMAASWRPP